jgi:cytoskeletal protein RodZ
MLPESHDELSQTLRQLKVAAPVLDRDRLIFEAGRRSVKRSWVWPMATAASVMVACLSGLMVWQQSISNRPQEARATSLAPVVQESITLQKMPAEPDETLSPLSYLALREESLTQKRPALPAIYSDTKPMPMLSAGSYVLPEWQR